MPTCCSFFSGHCNNVSPENMPIVIQNIRKVLKPNGRVLFRDYAIGDLAQERFTGKEQKISENFYVRGDGTRAFYFSDEFLGNLFKENGFNMEEHVLCCKQVENRSREIVMNRRWVQAVFRVADTDSMSCPTTGNELIDSQLDCNKAKDDVNGLEIDMSEGMAVEMFGISSSCEEIVELSIRDYSFKIKLLSKEYQHICPSTGLMLWESARLMASVLAANPEIVSRKKVLELGCGCSGISSVIAATSADLVVATDGDTKALELLTVNVASNLKSPSLDSLNVRKLEWGNENDIEAIKQLNEKGFDIIIGTDVTYVAEAIIPLFATARELITTRRFAENNEEPALILCHVFRRVDEPSILSAASKYGFRLVDSWTGETPDRSSGDIIKNWFSECKYEVPSAALNIMYFHNA
ncbi:putative methyltransferase [Handroanthus impetiginosus]|uniref:Putative methyltransferase n=1 Tax=Handroanthus impetiginosus TaxID=429701 RepID=A0A2G9HVR0_9LAMI|nr:putative methyltransferase [Handroanthus impetiginosus]